MQLVALVIAVSAGAWALWVRRHCWRSRWERAGNSVLVLQGAALLLASPYASDLLGTYLHDHAFLWHTEDFTAHSLFIGSAIGVARHATTRLNHNIQIAYLRTALALAGPLLGLRLWLFATNHLTLYWVVLCIAVIAHLSYATKLMLELWDEPRHRPTIGIYLFGALSGILTCAAAMILAVFEPPSMDLPEGIWLGCCFAVTGWAFGFAYSWWQRTDDLLQRGSVPVDPVFGDAAA